MYVFCYRVQASTHHFGWKVLAYNNRLFSKCIRTAQSLMRRVMGLSPLRMDHWSTDYQRVGWLQLYVLSTHQLWKWDLGRACNDAKLGRTGESGLHTQRFWKCWRLGDWIVGRLVSMWLWWKWEWEFAWHVLVRGKGMVCCGLTREGNMRNTFNWPASFVLCVF